MGPQGTFTCENKSTKCSRCHAAGWEPFPPWGRLWKGEGGKASPHPWLCGTQKLQRGALPYALRSARQLRFCPDGHQLSACPVSWGQASGAWIQFSKVPGKGRTRGCQHPSFPQRELYLSTENTGMGTEAFGDTLPRERHTEVFFKKSCFCRKYSELGREEVNKREKTTHPWLERPEQCPGNPASEPRTWDFKWNGQGETLPLHPSGPRHHHYDSLGSPSTHIHDSGDYSYEGLPLVVRASVTVVLYRMYVNKETSSTS